MPRGPPLTNADGKIIRGSSVWQIMFWLCTFAFAAAGIWLSPFLTPFWPYSLGVLVALVVIWLMWLADFFTIQTWAKIALFIPLMGFAMWLTYTYLPFLWGVGVWVTVFIIMVPIVLLGETSDILSGLKSLIPGSGSPRGGSAHSRHAARRAGSRRSGSSGGGIDF
jgi:hypothetical protein